MVHQGLMEKCHEDRTAPYGLQAQELMERGFPPELREPFHPVGVEGCEVPSVDAHVEQTGNLLEGLHQLWRRIAGGVPPEPIEHRAPRRGVGDEEAIDHDGLGRRQQRHQPTKRLCVRMASRSYGDPWLTVVDICHTSRIPPAIFYRYIALGRRAADSREHHRGGIIDRCDALHRALH